MSPLSHPLAYFFPFLAGIALLEALWLLRGHGNFDWQESLASVGVALGQQLVGLLSKGLVLGGFFWLWQYRLWTLPLNQAWSWGLVFLGVEFCYYWEHRCGHTVNWFWASHSVHHSPRCYNLSMAYRLGWTGVISGGPLFFAPLILLGMHPLAVVGMLGINLLYQFWLHTELIPKLGPLEWVLNTPSHHRVHHARNPQYIDRNFGGILIVFDRLFGTFCAENTPCRYGLVTARYSHNPLRIAFAGWLELWRSVRAEPSVGLKLARLVASPAGKKSP